MSGDDSEIGLTDRQLSALYRNADFISRVGQRRTKRLVMVELLALLMASVTGTTTLRVGSSGLDVLAVASAGAFLVAMGCTILRSIKRPEEDWYAGRAAAESARTLGWRFAAGGEPFPPAQDERETAALFLKRLGQLLDQLEGSDITPPASEDGELTPAMKRLRTSDLPTRRRVYKRDRIEDQLAWYERRARQHSGSAGRWLRLAVLASFLGVVAAALKFFLVDVDLLGVFAGLASSAIAWNQLNQHRNQATAYSVTVREIRIIRDRIDLVPDGEWARFVSDSEDAISREHTMWLARHGRPAARRT